ncbi:capsular polysaccharide transport system permease protein [Sphingobium sp. B7D2B]|uniref:hypothetical protein n=1 Tax=Sphingobium sp. B7D2B TaxID=2940583 RepID=UPI0022244ECF|nr:hypothetical protein [Sphingobium sp. B7D2B]MCW2366822.1 capsular polysaccharide transport system permease protein [Sphingobium sp. B7D2B]
MNKVRNLGVLFFLTVILPTSVAIVYFWFLASDIYISESKYVVRSPEKSSSSMFGGLLKSAGFSSSGDEMYAAHDYLISRDALQALNQNGAVVKAYRNPSVSVFDRFDTTFTGGKFEDLYRYYKRKVDVQFESTTSITTLTVRAYTPQEAQLFNERLLEMVEGTVNRLNTRGRQDLIRFATAEVEEAERKVRDTAQAVSIYRNREGVIDPERQAAVQLQMISKLQDELITARNQLLQLRAFAPQNPQVDVLSTKISGLSEQIDVELGKVAGGRASLSSTAAQYQRLALENEFAEKQLASAMVALTEARNEARRKQTYVERIVQPNLPDEPLEPRRLRGIFATIALGLVAWGILSMLLAGIKEHQD